MPLIIALYNNHACPFPVCKAQPRAAPFRLIFDPFRREHKNRHDKMQTSNGRSSTKGASCPSIVAHYNKNARPFPVCKAQPRSAPFRPILHDTKKLTCCSPSNSNSRISIRKCLLPFYHSTRQSSHLSLPALQIQQNATPHLSIVHHFRLTLTPPAPPHSTPAMPLNATTSRRFTCPPIPPLPPLPGATTATLS